MRLLKNAYEQNLPQCIGAPQRGDFFHISNKNNIANPIKNNIG